MLQDLAPHRFDNSYHPDRSPSADSPILVFSGRKLLCRLTDGALTLPTRAALADAAGTYRHLFRVDEEDFFLLDSPAEPSPAGFGWENIALFRTAQPRRLAFAAVTGFHLASWYRENRFCGCCGTPMVHDETLRMVRCPACGQMVFPKIMPSVIVAVTRGDKLLLTRYNRPGAQRTALIAGFTEIGETAEETVVREVYEEVGLRVRNLRYYKSQPWGISAGGLLLGFWCEAEGDDEPRVDGEELAEAAWVSRDELRAQYVDNGVSLTNEMIVEFKLGRSPSLRG